MNLDLFRSILVFFTTENHLSHADVVWTLEGATNARKERICFSMNWTKWQFHSELNNYLWKTAFNIQPVCASFVLHTLTKTNNRLLPKNKQVKFTSCLVHEGLWVRGGLEYNAIAVTFIILELFIALRNTLRAFQVHTYSSAFIIRKWVFLCKLRLLHCY